MKANKMALFPWVLALTLRGSPIVDWGATMLDIGIGSHTYKYIHHRSQKKLRRLARQRG